MAENDRPDRQFIWTLAVAFGGVAMTESGLLHDFPLGTWILWVVTGVLILLAAFYRRLDFPRAKKLIHWIGAGSSGFTLVAFVALFVYLSIRQRPSGFESGWPDAIACTFGEVNKTNDRRNSSVSRGIFQLQISGPRTGTRGVKIYSLAGGCMHPNYLCDAVHQKVNGHDCDQRDVDFSNQTSNPNDPDNKYMKGGKTDDVPRSYSPHQVWFNDDGTFQPPPETFAKGDALSVSYKFCFLKEIKCGTPTGDGSISDIKKAGNAFSFAREFK
jgi:hypothetical protein